MRNGPLGLGVGLGICGLELVLIVASLAAMIWAVVDCVKRQFKDDTMKIIWIIVIVVLGLVGVIIYAIVGRPMGTLPGDSGIDRDRPA